MFLVVRLDLRNNRACSVSHPYTNRAKAEAYRNRLSALDCFEIYKVVEVAK